MYGHGPTRVCVLGGGVLGVEIAASLTQLGVKIDLLLSRNHPWHKFAGEHTGRFITGLLESHGIAVHANSLARALEGDGRNCRVRAGDDKTIPCDFATATVGGSFNRDLLRRHRDPLQQTQLLADEHTQTNLPYISPPAS